MNPSEFNNLFLVTGHTIISLELSNEPITDARGNEALGWTQTIGREMRIQILAELDEKEISVTLYHEVLEAVLLSCRHPPNSMVKFCESDFDLTAYAMYEKIGAATPNNINHMLQILGFRPE